MKREFITGLLPDIAKDVLDQIMAEHGKDIEAQKNTITTLTTERDGLKTQLGTAKETIKSYEEMDVDGIKQSAKDWETKYNTDTQKLKDDLDAANYGFSVKEAIADVKFTSKGARNDFISALTAKKLPLQEGKLLGLEDFKKEYQTSDPGAFKPEDDNKTPIVTRGTGGGAQLGADAAMRAALGLPAEKKE